MPAGHPEARKRKHHIDNREGDDLLLGRGGADCILFRGETLFELNVSLSNLRLGKFREFLSIFNFKS